VHKAIRRMAPAPRARVPRGKVITDVARKPSEQVLIDVEEDTQPNGNGNATPRKLSLPETSGVAPLTSFLKRRRSSGPNGDESQVYEHLKHLGPSNHANRPLPNRINTVKIKPGNPTIPQTIPENARPATPTNPAAAVVSQDSHAPEGGVGEGLLASAGREASDGVHSVALGYGTITAPTGDRMSWKSSRSFSSRRGSRGANDEPRSPKSKANGDDDIVVNNGHQDDNDDSRPRTQSVSTIASLRSHRSQSKSPPARRHTARSGSISENIVDVNGIKKIVLETTSSSDSDDKVVLVADADGAEDKGHSDVESTNTGGNGGSKKKRKKRGKKKKGGNAGESSESQPLLGDK
jgi:metal transporter CNNM